MPFKIIQGSEQDFSGLGNKRFVGIIETECGERFAVRSLDADKVQDIIHINGGTGRFFDAYGSTLNRYFDGFYKVIAERIFINNEEK